MFYESGDDGHIATFLAADRLLSAIELSQEIDMKTQLRWLLVMISVLALAGLA